MSKTVTFTEDVYPYCVGDVQVLSDDELKAVDKIAKARNHKVYKSGAVAEVDSSAEYDRQQAELEAQAVNSKEAEAKVALQEAAGEKAKEQGVPDPSGHIPAGTSGDTTVKTAAAAGKKR